MKIEIDTSEMPVVSAALIKSRKTPHAPWWRALLKKVFKERQKPVCNPYKRRIELPPEPEPRQEPEEIVKLRAILEARKTKKLPPLRSLPDTGEILLKDLQF